MTTFRNVLLLLASTTAIAACSENPADSNATTATSEDAGDATEAMTAADEPLAVGSAAPMFVTAGAMAGEEFELNLNSALKDGPVVLYFFPAAFTQGCTLEAREFAQRNADFEALGARVIGMSGDDIETLQRFSTEECRDEFAVAQATPEIIAGYGVTLGEDSPLTSRTSYVIAQDGTIAFMHDDSDYSDHVRLTYEAVQALEGATES